MWDTLWHGLQAHAAYPVLAAVAGAIGGALHASTDTGSPLTHWLQAAAYAVFAAVAGVLGYVMRMMDAGSPVKFWRSVVEGSSAGFVGLLAMWLCQAVHVGPEWTAVTVGVSGWMGARASIQMLQRAVWKKLGLNGSQDHGADDATT